MCVLCTLLFMMSIEALGVKREKEKKKSSLWFSSYFIFFVSTQHTRTPKPQNSYAQHQIKPPHQRITSREDQTRD